MRRAWPVVTRFAGLAAAIAMLLAVSGCIRITSAPPTAIQGSGEVVTQTYDFAEFTRVEARQAFQVEVTVGGPFSLTVTTDDNVVEVLDIGVAGSTLRIGLDENVTLSTGTLEAQVTMPDLEEVRASGASTVTIEGLTGANPLEVQASGASAVSSSDVIVADLQAQLSGASRLELSGSAGNLDLSASGASIALLADLSVNDADVELSGASRAQLDASGSISGGASGGSVLTYSGTPASVDVDGSGASMVRAE